MVNAADQFKRKWSGLFPKFISMMLKSKENNKEKETFQILNGEDPKYSVELNLVKSPPSSFCFTFKYGDYFTEK